MMYLVYQDSIIIFIISQVCKNQKFVSYIYQYFIYFSLSDHTCTKQKQIYK
ncbi:hypothetical protein pb186bvf_012402 [Paramecium bursaria]